MLTNSPPGKCSGRSRRWTEFKGKRMALSREWTPFPRRRSYLVVRRQWISCENAPQSGTRKCSIADSRRRWDRQGSFGALDSRNLRSERRRICKSKLRSHSPDTARERTVWLRKGGVLREPLAHGRDVLSLPTMGHYFWMRSLILILSCRASYCIFSRMGAFVLLAAT